IVLQFSAAEDAISGFEVGQGHALAVLMEGRVLIHCNGLRLTIRAGNFNLSAVDRFNLTHDEVLSQTLLEITHHSRRRDGDLLSLYAAIASLFSTNENSVPHLHIGQLRILPLLAETGLVRDVHCGGVTVFGFDCDGVAADRSHFASHARCAAPST